MAAGELVDDDLVEAVVRERLAEHDWNYGFVVDGFPRNAAQAEFFLESYDIDGVILLEMPDARGAAAGAGPAAVPGLRPRLQPARQPARRSPRSATCAAAGLIDRRGRPARTRSPPASPTTTPRRSPHDRAVRAQGVRRPRRRHTGDRRGPGGHPAPARPAGAGARAPDSVDADRDRLARGPTRS